MELFQYPYMQRALIGALVIGLAAPALGIYLVQRRLALIGDGVGHVALTGVGAGLLLNRSPVLVAVIAATIGAIAIEMVRARGRTSGDLALALLFYGGIAGGVLLVGLSDATSANLNAYLFGSLITTSPADLITIAVLGAAILVTMIALRPALFAVSHDEEYARVSGLPVRTLNLLIAVATAVTVTIAMRAVGRAADQRADGGAGRHRPAGHPGLPQHDGRRDGARALRRRLGCLGGGHGGHRAGRLGGAGGDRLVPGGGRGRRRLAGVAPPGDTDRRADTGTARGRAELSLISEASVVLVTVAG